MPRQHYPDSVRREAVRLFEAGDGYKAIARKLNLSRDTVRYWISIYRLNGRTESTPPRDNRGAAATRQKTAEAREEKYRGAREEYETSSASLQDISRKHGLVYANFSHYLRKYHPESALLHAYVKQVSTLKTSIEEQRAYLDDLEQALLRKLSSQLQSALARLKLWKSPRNSREVR